MPTAPSIGPACAAALLASSLAAQDRWAPEIPRTWDEQEIAAFELPLARPESSPEHVSAAYYYATPVRTIWRSYPVYHPDHEPAGYREELLEKEPEVAFSPDRLHTEQDWIEAGREVFRTPLEFDGPIVRPDQVRDPAWLARFDFPVAEDGTLPYLRWVVREKGRPELGNLSCAMCHTRVLDDGTQIVGAQSNLPFDPPFAATLRSGVVPDAILRNVIHTLVGTPWEPDPASRKLSMDALADAFEAVPRGAMIRQGTGLGAPAKVPDLIGIKDRRYLDASGLVRHRGIGDLMRYAATNQGMDTLARFGDFVPATHTAQRPPPGEGGFSGNDERFSDEQLYALAKFLYALQPPTNPYPSDDRARRGEEIFERESCTDCHPAPHYTSNELVRAPGFTPPAEHYGLYDVSKRRVRTDPELAMNTRRGTGYYKIPSLRGLWYRGGLGHDAAVPTLEEWFEERRIDEGTFVGHRFGLDLTPEEKDALIAFLRTL